MSREIKHLSPWMREKAKLFLDRCREEKLDIIIICTYRGAEEQQRAFDSKASKARPGQSAHNAVDSLGRPCSEAFDVGVIRNGKYIGDAEDKDYQKAGLIGEELGLEWAMRWKRNKEAAHFQSPYFSQRKLP